ncbi:hypothetical protein WJX82_005585 [Trebouxia sp. C0006]
MPTAAELALQKKYAELRAKKQKAADVKTATAHTPPTRQSDGHIKVTVRSKQSSKPAKQAAPAVKQAPKITLRSNPSKQNSLESKKAPAVPTASSKALAAPLVPSDPQSAALEAAKIALAARQATRDKEKLAQSKVTKRPTFKRPAAKLPGPPIPADDEPAQPTKRARLDTHLQQNEALASKPRVGVHPPNADVADHPQAWSPTQHANLPYSPGVEGTAWSPTAASKAPHHTQAGYSPGAHQAEQGYSPSHHPGPAAEEVGYDQDHSFTYTGAAQAAEALAGPSNQADRSLFVGDVLDEVTDIELADYFSNVGEVLSAQIRGNDGGHYAFLEFAYPDDVHRVLSLAQDQPFEMYGQPLKVQPRRPKDQQQASLPPGQSQYGQPEFEYQEPELPAARQARIQAEVKQAAAAAVDELDPEELRHLAPAPPPDRQLMVYDDI